jgi:SagB-type dehydrogenase family enzyme
MNGMRTVDPLVLECEGGLLRVSSPRTVKRLRVEPDVLDLLLQARKGLPDGWQTNGRAPLIKRLIDFGFLVDAEEEDVPVPWRDMGVAAWSFHNRVRDYPFLDKDATEKWEKYVERISEHPRPSSLPRFHSDKILLLPRVWTQPTASYLDVLQSRRTHRQFQDVPVGLDQFSNMLCYSFAPIRFADAGPLGVMQMRAAASGGARHECEAYVCVFDVEHVEPGLYAYDGLRHGLVPVESAVTRDQVEDLTYHQRFFRTASFGVFTIAVTDRLSWKYPNPRAYKFLLQNVGHVAQVFSMNAVALGLGAALTGAIKDSEADALLGLDTPREFTTFAMACGVPETAPDGLPVLMRVPQTAPSQY